MKLPIHFQNSPVNILTLLYISLTVEFRSYLNSWNSKASEVEQYEQYKWVFATVGRHGL